MRKTWSFQFIKWLVSENPSAMNMLMNPKYCSDLQKSNFTPLFHQFRTSWVRKGYFLSELKFEESLLTRSNRIRYFNVPTDRVYRYHFKCKYPNIRKTKEILLHLFCVFGIYIQFLMFLRRIDLDILSIFEFHISERRGCLNP